MVSLIRNKKEERRRANRVLLRVPVSMMAQKNGRLVNESAETVVVSRWGALLQTRSPMRSGTVIELTNDLSQRVESFRVVWSGPQPVTGQYSVGVESLATREGFWGVHFPPLVPAR